MKKSLLILALEFRQPRAFPQNIALATKNPKIGNIWLPSIEKFIWSLVEESMTI
jgi:hypothetical protein